jgi:prevent-host-death family protein
MAARTFGLAEAKNRLSELIERVEQGEEITITRHDEAVARLVPARGPSREEAKQAVSNILALRARRALPMSTAEILALKKAGRR